MELAVNKIIVLVVCLAVAAGAFLLAFQSPTGAASANAGQAREITVKAFKYGYDPSTITLNKGETVRIKINNIDVLHGIRIPSLNIKGNEEIIFTADKIGEFPFYCTNYCGENHSTMQGKIIVK